MMRPTACIQCYQTAEDGVDVCELCRLCEDCHDHAAEQRLGHLRVHAPRQEPRLEDLMVVPAKKEPQERG